MNAIMLRLALWSAQLSARKCKARGHDWFPPPRSSEFLPIRSSCMRCRVETVSKPYGMCLGGHPIAEHYNDQGVEIPVPHCTTGRPW